MFIVHEQVSKEKKLKQIKFFCKLMFIVHEQVSKEKKLKHKNFCGCELFFASQDKKNHETAKNFCGY